MELFHIIGQFFPPDLSAKYLAAALGPLMQTLSMAAAAMLMAIVAGLGAAVWVGARLPGARFVYRALSVIRSIPDLTLAILCVVIVGIGPAAGTLALAIFYTAALGKVCGDLFTTAAREPVDALQATGATRLAVAFFGLLPLRLKDILSYGSYEFESAVRASVIVGAVGGGGLGTELAGTINALDFHRTTTLILMLIVLVALIDLLARWIKHKPAMLVGILPLAGLALWVNRPSMLALSHSMSTFASMLPPHLPAAAVGNLPGLLVETLAIAVGGTLFAIIPALPLGLLASRNMTPAFVSLPARRILEAFRAVPEVVWGLVLVSLIGVGPKAGIVALALHGTGSLGRLYAESFENIDTAPVDAITATGAPPIARAAFAYVPLALPPIAVHTLFRLEWNVRAATVVGVIGAGGIGQALYNAQQLFFYRQMAAYVLVTWILVSVVDLSSTRFRRGLNLMEVYG